MRCFYSIKQARSQPRIFKGARVVFGGATIFSSICTYMMLKTAQCVLCSNFLSLWLSGGRKNTFIERFEPAKFNRGVNMLIKIENFS
jgi:hypothetical protein